MKLDNILRKNKSNIGGSQSDNRKEYLASIETKRIFEMIKSGIEGGCRFCEKQKI